MRKLVLTIGTAILSASVLTTAAQAACSGTNGRGWGSGRGAGQFEMRTADKICKISFPGFVDDVAKTRTPATKVTITTKPKNGALTVVAGQGIIYTPKSGFKGSDKFCTRNTSPKVRGKSLSGCVTVTVR